MRRRCLILILASVFMLSWSAAGQESSAADLTEKVRTLQSQLVLWQTELAGLHFEEMTTDEHWLTQFNRERSQCLGAMKLASYQITRIQITKGNTFPLAGEFELSATLGRLQDCLGNLGQFVLFAFGTAPQASHEAAVLNKWMREPGLLLGMGKAVSIVNGLLKENLYHRLDAIDIGEPDRQQK